MASITLRHYGVTLAYRTQKRGRRLKYLHKSLRLNFSKRRLKQHLRSIFYARTLK